MQELNRWMQGHRITPGMTDADFVPKSHASFLFTYLFIQPVAPDNRGTWVPSDRIGTLPKVMNFLRGSGRLEMGMH